MQLVTTSPQGSLPCSATRVPCGPYGSPMWKHLGNRTETLGGDLTSQRGTWGPSVPMFATLLMLCNTMLIS